MHNTRQYRFHHPRPLVRRQMRERPRGLPGLVPALRTQLGRHQHVQLHAHGPLLPRGADGRLFRRPEHLMIDSSVGAIGIGKAEVVRLEDLGHETHLHVRTSRGLELTARVGGETRGNIPLGATVSVSIRPETLHVFDRSSGERLQ